MPPLLALLVCCCFVLLLLRLDKRSAQNVSLSLWVPTTWLIYCASRPISYWLAPTRLIEGDLTVAEGSPIDRVFLITLILLGIAILARRKVDWNAILKDNAWLFAIFGYMLLSVIWSDFAYVSLKRWVKTFGTVIMALVVITEESPRESFEVMLRRSVYILIPFSMLLIKYYPEYGVSFGRWSGQRTWVGVSTQKNGLGRLCMVSAAYLLWIFLRRKEGDADRPHKHQALGEFILLALSLWMLKGPGGSAYSATSISVLLVGVGSYALLVKNRARLASLEIYFLIGFFLFFMADTVAQIVAHQSLGQLVMPLLGRDATLTGRTWIWEELLAIAWKHPILGVGYGSFWIDPPISFNVNQGHNGYLDVFLELGGVGVALLIGFCASLYRKFRRALVIDFHWAGFAICFLIVSLMYNYSESGFLRSTSHLWVLLVFIAVVFPGGIQQSTRATSYPNQQPYSGRLS